MRRIVSAAVTLTLAFSFVLAQAQGANANALAGGGYSSSYAGESVFTNKAAGESGQFSVIFFNDGTQAWAPGIVGLLICNSDKVTCGVSRSDLAPYAKSWYSSTVYATVQSGTGGVGQNGFFIYDFTVPTGTAPGTEAVFNGDLGLIANGLELRPEGYFQINTAPAVTGEALTISPTSASLGIGGQQQFTTTGGPTGATVTWSVTGGCGAVTQAGLFVATATNSSTQPCTVVASASGQTASASITVFGSASTVLCSATKTTIAADGTTTVISGTLKDVNNNTVANDNSTVVTFTNNSPTILTPTAAAGVTASSGVASKTYTSVSTGSANTGVVSLSSGSLTGCTQQIATTAPGAAAKLAATFYLGTVSADNISKSILKVDVTDVNGVINVTDGTTQITVSRDSGSTVCNLSGSGSGGPTTVSTGSAYFTVTATTTPGTCSWTASANVTGVASASATLTTILSGAPNKLVVSGSTSPQAADGIATMLITVALQDANGNAVTTPAQQVALTATLGTGCSGTKANGDTDSVKIKSDVTSVNTVSAVSTTGNRTSYAGASTNLARFTLSSSFASAGCTVTFSDGSSVSSATSTVVFTAGGPADVACNFSPRRIINDGSSTSVGTVSMVDSNNNLSTSGTFSVSFSRTTGTSSTLLTTSPQNTSAGIAQFTVKSTTTEGTDTYTASATVSGANQTGTCVVGVTSTLP